MTSLKDWHLLATKELGASPEPRPTPEGIDIKPLYTAEDLANLDTSSLPGFAPFDHLREHDEEVGKAAVRDPHLFAAEDEAPVGLPQGTRPRCC